MQNKAEEVRLCQSCGHEIPKSRLAAQPNAALCVQCLEARGDVPHTKRFDEYTPSGERVGTYFRSNPRIERQLNKFLHKAPSDEDLATAAGDDDAHLDMPHDMVRGYRLGDVVTDEE